MKDVGLETLLALDGTEYTEENGYWYKIEAFLTDVNGGIKPRINGAGYLQAHIPQNAAEWKAAV